MPNPANHCRFLGRRILSLAVAVCLVLGAAAPSSAQTQTLAPNYWQQRLFFIPYQVHRQAPSLHAVAKVQLLISRDGVTDWRVLEEAEPNVQGFTYHAPDDGEYWFALRHLDRRGEPWPNKPVQPQMRVVVDTVSPALELSGVPDGAGAVVVRYEARDLNLRPETFALQVRVAGGEWSPLSPGPPDVTHVDRLVGRASWNPPAGTSVVEVRGTIADSAGRQTAAQTEVPVSGPKPNSSNSRPTLQPPPGMAADPFRNRPNVAMQDWPADNHLPSKPTPPAESVADTNHLPPETNVYTSPGASDSGSRTPAHLIGEGQVDVRPARQPIPHHSAMAEDAASRDGNVRTVNSATFDVEYDLQSVGSWRVAKVELWGTQDGGRTWQSFGVDNDNRSPVRVTVPGAGVYGFLIRVKGANGAGSPPPKSGEQPELVVAVDLEPPRVESLTAELGQGNLEGHLVIRWSANDTNLESQPVSLFYGTFPHGPWSTIATALPNTGSYMWRLERHMPDRFYVRLEARDLAGNLGSSQTPAPITLDRPQPSGRLRGVRPVSINPPRYDTAERELLTPGATSQDSQSATESH